MTLSICLKTFCLTYSILQLDWTGTQEPTWTWPTRRVQWASWRGASEDWEASWVRVWGGLNSPWAWIWAIKSWEGATAKLIIAASPAGTRIKRENETGPSSGKISTGTLWWSYYDSSHDVAAGISSLGLIRRCPRGKNGYHKGKESEINKN